jgi:alkaline phosphatase D
MSRVTHYSAQMHTRLTMAFAALITLGLSATAISVTPSTSAAPNLPRLSPDSLIERIAFGSCLDEEKTPPPWDEIRARQPDVFMMLGDNVYADTEAGVYVGPNLEIMQRSYAALGAQTGFQALRSEVPTLAVWDDHDYGVNDGGAENPIKNQAKDIFAQFFDVPADDPMRSREGTYRAGVYGPEGQRVQIIQLDTRWFRSSLKETDELNTPGKQRFIPDNDPAKTLLGDAQWQWLAEQLRTPAELRFIVSSIQVLSDGHGWERWGNFPHELSRLFDLIRQTNAHGVIFLSGDRHRAAAYRQIKDTPYPFYELTSSSLNAGVASRQPEIDPHRLGGKLYPGENFGEITIDWTRGVVHLDILSLPGTHRVRGVTLAIAELQP